MHKYQDSTLSVEVRIDDLIAKMSISEKIGQMTNLRGYDQYQRTGEQVALLDSFKQQFNELQVGSLTALCRADWYSGRNRENGLTPKLLAKTVNMFQQYAVENSRWGIPLWIGEPTVHGLMVLGGTVFPGVTGMGSTWNTELIEKIYAVAAAEANSARICRGCLSLDIARDPRWSRVEECFSEDPYLVAQMGVASTFGLQGRSFPNKGKVVAVMRHFGGHGDPEGGHNAAPCHIGPIEAHNVHFKPFRECAIAGARGLMSAYNTIDGIPCTGNRDLLTGMLREKWGFNGYVVPDAGAIPQLKWNRFVETDAEACAMAVKAGVDMDLWNVDFYVPAMKQALQKGLLAEADINEAVRHLLRVKFEMGLFENPYAEESRPTAILGCRAHREVALQAARESLILLANPNKMLPLTDIKKLAVIGPNADTHMNQLGDYTAPQKREDVITVLDGIKALAETQNITVSYAKGCKIRSLNRDGMDEALQVTNISDAAILVLGGASGPDEEIDFLPTGEARCKEIQENSEIDKESGEGYDRAALRLAGLQLELFRELKATGKPVIVVLIMGRPLIIDEVLNKADAVLLAWYPGMMGGMAVAEALFGKYNPGGKLPISFPRDEGQLPIYYNSHQPRRDYIDMASTPLLSFGFGLSYTTFAYSDLTLDQTSITNGDTIKVTVKVMNTGDVAGDEIVQLYLTDQVSSVARPYRELRGFRRIHLAAGSAQTVVFELSDAELGLYNRKLEYVVEPGRFTVAVGGGLDSLLETEFKTE